MERSQGLGRAAAVLTANFSIESAAFSKESSTKQAAISIKIRSSPPIIPGFSIEDTGNMWNLNPDFNDFSIESSGIVLGIVGIVLGTQRVLRRI